MKQHAQIMELLLEGQRLLENWGIQSSRLEAELLMASLLKCDRSHLYLNRGWVLQKNQIEKYWEMVRKRCRGIPVQYITRYKEFMGLLFHVDERVLIPRGDTEFLVEWVIKWIGDTRSPVKILDMGTGSGAIAVSLAKLIACSYVTAVDIEQGALEVARMNARYHGVEKRIDFRHGDLFEALNGESVENAFDVLVSNPPYIPTEEIKCLESQVRDCEPRSALDGGRDGLDFYRRLALEAGPFLKPGALWAVEAGYDQASHIKEILMEAGHYGNIRFIKDMNGFDRIVTAIYNWKESMHA